MTKIILSYKTRSQPKGIQNRLSTILDLVFYFVDELLPDQMPETVHLMPQGACAQIAFILSSTES